MTDRDKIVMAHEEDDVEYAMEMFTENRIRHLPVFAGNKLVGVVSIGDVVRALLADSRFQRKMMMDYITGGV
jgi:CBS domain-containing protein